MTKPSRDKITVVGAMSMLATALGLGMITTACTPATPES
jgi:hypothetical protein